MDLFIVKHLRVHRLQHEQHGRPGGFSCTAGGLAWSHPTPSPVVPTQQAPCPFCVRESRAFPAGSADCSWWRLVTGVSGCFRLGCSAWAPGESLGSAPRGLAGRRGAAVPSCRGRFRPRLHMGVSYSPRDPGVGSFLPVLSSIWFWFAGVLAGRPGLAVCTRDPSSWGPRRSSRG